MSYNYRLSNRLYERDIHVLHMYLDGATNEDMTNYLTPDRRTKNEGSHKLKKVIRKLEITLKMPYKKMLCVRNRDAILNNLRLLQEYCAKYDEFIAKQDKEFAESGFKDLS